MDIGSTLTHHDSAIEALDPDSADNMTAHTFEDLTAANDKAIRMTMAVRMILQAFLVRNLLDRVALARDT